MATTVASLRPDQKGLTLTVKVVDAVTVLERQPRGDKGSSIKVAECLVADGTGSVIFVARNEQVDVATKGSVITLKNAKVDMNRTNIRVSVDEATGKVEAEGELQGAVNTANNMSLLEFELVQVGQA